MPEQRADRSQGPCLTGGVRAGGALAIGFLTHRLDSVSVETGLMLTDSSMSFAQLSGVGVMFSLSFLVMVHTFSLFSVSSFLTFPIPLLVVRFTLWSSNDTTVGLGGETSVIMWVATLAGMGAAGT